MFFLQIKIENAVKSVKARDFDAYVAVEASIKDNRSIPRK